MWWHPKNGGGSEKLEGLQKLEENVLVSGFFKFLVLLSSSFISLDWSIYQWNTLPFVKPQIVQPDSVPNKIMVACSANNAYWYLMEIFVEKFQVGDCYLTTTVKSFQR